MNRRSLCARIVATLVAMIVAVWSTALCAAGIASSHASHACCSKKTQQTGPHAAASATCCGENSDNYFAASSAPVPVAPPPPVAVVTLIAASALSDHPLARVGAADAAALKPPKTPTYLAVSNFRL
jgi:hypothetical protein